LREGGVDFVDGKAFGVEVSAAPFGYFVMPFAFGISDCFEELRIALGSDDVFG